MDFDKYLLGSDFQDPQMHLQYITPCAKSFWHVFILFEM